MTLYNLVVHQPLGKSGNALVLESLDPAREYHQVASFTDIDKGIKDLANTVFGSDWANGPLDHPKNGQVAHRIISVAMAALVAGENYLGGAPRYLVRN